MVIEVELCDGVVVKVPPRGLDRLLERNLAKRFRRGSGWAVVGIHPIRAAPRGRYDYNGFERRRMDTRHVA